MIIDFAPQMHIVLYFRKAQVVYIHIYVYIYTYSY